MNNKNKSRVQKLVLQFMKDSDETSFKERFLKLDAREVSEFEEIILTNKISSQFISLITKKNLIDLMSEDFLRNIHYQTKRFQLHSLAIVREVAIIQEIFKQEGLSPIYLKGVALQHEYHDIVFRPLVDIDVLFKGDELLRAYEALHKNNVLRPSEKNYLNRNNIGHFCKFSHYINVVTNNDISIELHHRLSPIAQFVRCPITDEMFKNYREINYFGENINIPSIENLVIHQLVHFSLSHDFKSLLRTINDVMQISESYEINWQDIILKFDNQKIRKSICLSLAVIDKCGVSIKNLRKFQLLFKDYFPDQEIVNNAQIKLFETRRSKREELLLPKLLPENLSNTIYNLLVPKKGQLIYEYKISKLNFYNLSIAYIKKFLSQMLKLKYLYFIIKIMRDPAHNIESKNPISVWIDKS